MSDRTVVTINCSGSTYKISKHLLGGACNSKLHRLVLGKKLDKFELFIERPKSSFEAILSYFQTGHLHIPSSVCPGEFGNELQFWELDPHLLEKCCYQRFSLYEREQLNLKGFEDMTSSHERMDLNPRGFDKTSRGRRLLSKIWSIVDNRENSIASQAYFYLSTFFILLAIFGVAFSTLPEVMSRPDSNAVVKFKDVNVDFDSDETTDYSRSIDPDEISLEDHTDNNHNKLSSTVDNNLSLNNISGDASNKSKLFVFPDKADEKVLTEENAGDFVKIFLYIEHVTNAFFTVEFLIKMTCCPSIRQYFHSSLNVIDTLVLFSSYGRYVVLFTDLSDVSALVDALLYLQMFRVLRLLRIVENILAFKILCYSVRMGKYDLFVMFLFLVFGTMLFSNFIYYVESSSDFQSIPEAWWFTIVTMTTVGFGEVTPKTALGKILGAICALSGVLMFSLLIPGFVNHFHSIYMFAAMSERKKKETFTKEISNRKNVRANVQSEIPFTSL